MDTSPGASLGSSSTTTTTTTGEPHQGRKGRRVDTQSLWESINQARERINALKQVIGPVPSLEALQDTELPSKALLADEQVAEAIVAHLILPTSGGDDDALCNWLYDTFQTEDSDLQDIVIRFVPVLCGLYIHRVTAHIDNSLAGFEAVLIALYTAESKARNGRPIVINIPDLSHPSLYHSPRIPSNYPIEPQLGQLSAPLEPQDTIKATKTSCIVGVALDLFHRRIFVMPPKAKIEACQCALKWASMSCHNNHRVITNSVVVGSDAGGEKVLDVSSPSPSRPVPEIEIVRPGELFLGSKSPAHNSSSVNQSHNSMVPEASKENFASSGSLKASSSMDFSSVLMQAGGGIRIHLPWELLHPVIKILGHCLIAPMNSEEVKVTASAAVKALHDRSHHDLVPEAMLATRSLLRLQTDPKAMTKSLSISVNSTSSSSKPRKPEILLVSR